MNTNVVGVVPRIGRQLLGVAIGVCIAVATAQAQRTLTGRVTDAATKAPVPGAAVIVTGTQLGATTTDSGTFRINGVPATAVTLTARRIGYRPDPMPVAADQGEVTITMTQDVLQLEAQVVTGAATSISAQNSANAVSVLKPTRSTKSRRRPSRTHCRARSRAPHPAEQRWRARAAACRSRSAASRRSMPMPARSTSSTVSWSTTRRSTPARTRSRGPGNNGITRHARQQPESHRRHQPERHRVD